MERRAARHVRIDQLEPGHRYQVVVTTAGGLYRYAMNDLVEVAGVHRATPLLRFVQKGRGVTNLTGEKLYEAQVIEAVQAGGAAHGRHPPFFLMVADEAAPRYRALRRGRRPGAVRPARGVQRSRRRRARAPAIWSTSPSATAADCRCRRSRGSGPGAGDAYKAACVRAGQREGQYKPAVLVYERQMKLPAATLAAFAVD